MDCWVTIQNHPHCSRGGKEICLVTASSTVSTPLRNPQSVHLRMPSSVLSEHFVKTSASISSLSLHWRVHLAHTRGSRATICSSPPDLSAEIDTNINHWINKLVKSRKLKSNSENVSFTPQPTVTLSLHPLFSKMEVRRPHQQSSGWDSVLPRCRSWVWSLVRELGSHMLYGMP